MITTISFSSESNACTNTIIPNINLSYKDWLSIEGWVLFVILFSNVFFGGYLYCNIRIYYYYYGWRIVKCVEILWRLIWLILGSYMFWKYINNMSKCNHRVLNRYSWALLIFGYLSCIAVIVFVILYKPVVFNIPKITIP